MSLEGAAAVATPQLVIRPLGEAPDPPSSVFEGGGRGVAIHWSTPGTVDPKPKRRKRSQGRVWASQAIRFRVLRGGDDDRAPQNDAEARRMILQAYVFAASHHPIPSDAPIYYEVMA